MRRAVREMLSSVETFRGMGNTQQPDVRPSASVAPATPDLDFGGTFITGTSTATPGASQAGSVKPLAGTSHDPFNMLAAHAPAQKPMQADMGFADFQSAIATSKPTHTGHDSLI